MPRYGREEGLFQAEGGEAALDRLAVQSIAVCYLFSFINPKHEQRTAAIIHEEHPTARVS